MEITCKMRLPSISRLGNPDQHKADPKILRWPVVEELLDAQGTLVRLPGPSRTGTLRTESWNNPPSLWVVPAV